MAIVYQHKVKNTEEVFYIGIGKQDKRAYSKHGRGKFWKDYTSKHEFIVEITHKDIIWEEACSIEKYLIAFYGRRDLGLGSLVNQTDGGDGIINPSQETRKKNGDSHRGLIAWNKGLTKDTNEKVKEYSKKLFGKERSDTHSKNISKAKKGKANPTIQGDKNPGCKPENREKSRNRLLGNKYREGKPHNEQTKNKQREKALNREKKECEICKKLVDPSNYIRWHGKNCKNKNK
jgi:hypothetical protein